MTRLLALTAVLLLALAACGGDTGDTTTTEAAAESTTTEAVPETSEATTETTEAASGFVAAGSVPMQVADGSLVRFRVAEVLRGDDVTVVATNRGVSGEVTVDFDDPDASLVGTITVDANGFATDEDRRNTAIRQFILDAADFPEIVFTPTAFAGATDVLTGGTGTITGDLTIRDVTNPVTFDVTDAEVTEDGLSANATATVNRTDWGLNIPSVPFVASVGEEVTLELVLVLTP